MSTPPNPILVTTTTGGYAAPPNATAVPVFDIESYQRLPGYAEQTTDRMGAWRAGVFDCWKHSVVPNCCMVTLCPCVSLAQVIVRIGCVESYGAMLFTTVFIWVFSAICVVLMMLRVPSSDGAESERHLSLLPLAVANFWFLFSLSVYIARRKTRFMFKIEEEEYCEDLVLSSLCTPCTLAQIATHSQSYTPHSCSFGRPDTLPPFQVD